MKKIKLLAVAAVGFGLFLCSCEGTSDPREKTGRKTNNTAKVIEKHIVEMESQPWDKSVYTDIRDNQIANLKGSTNEKNSLNDLLVYSYGIVLVREGNGVLDDCDKDKHGHLKDVMTELESFPNAKDAAALQERYRTHKAMMDFIGSLSAKQSVRSVNDKYDTSFEKQKEKKAKEYLATSPSCKYITSQLSNTKSYFQSRRKDYANKLVNLYCAQDEYDQATELRVKGNINAACGSLTKDQTQKMNDFKEQKLKEAEAN